MLQNHENFSGVGLPSSSVVLTPRRRFKTFLHKATFLALSQSRTQFSNNSVDKEFKEGIAEKPFVFL
jgi:hypothetical protein